MAVTPEQDYETSAASEMTGSRTALALALLLGFAGIAVIAFVSHWVNLLVVTNWYYLVSTIMPLAFFLLILVVAVVNPLLHAFLPKLVLRRRELLLALTMWLVGAVVAHHNGVAQAVHAAGTMQHFESRAVNTQRVFFEKKGDAPQTLRSDWFKSDLFLSRQDDAQYVQGVGDGRSLISLGRVPWRVWARPLLFWVPLAFVSVLFASTLVQVVHRQWSRHELLTYPIASITDSLLEARSPRKWPDLFYDKIFWLGFGITAVIFIINGLQRWFPLMIEVPLHYWHTDLMREFNFLSRHGAREFYSLFRGWIWPFVVAIGVFLPLEISFSFWAGWIILIIAPGIYFLFSGHAISMNETASVRTGMYIAMLAVIVGIGWKEYLNILRRAVVFWRPSEDATLRAAARACRGFVLCFAALVALLMHAGLHALAAVTMTCGFALVVILMARMTAETGLPWLVSFTGASRVLPLKLLGAAALGPQALAVMAVVGVVLDGNTGTSIAGQETLYRKLEEKQRTGLPRWGLNLIVLAAVVAAMAGGTIANLWTNYSFGAQKDITIRGRLSGEAEMAANDINRLKHEGKDAEPASTWDRLALVKPEPRFWRFFLGGAGIIVIVAFMRLRFTWWPLHPLPFLLIDTWALGRLYQSFFIAWVIKMILLRVGGGKVFNRAKPFFIGVIAGEIVVLVFWIIVAMLYYLVQRVAPPGGTLPLV